MNFKNLWDKQDTKAMELNSVASLLYADEYYIIFNKYIYVLPDEKNHHGKLIDELGVICRKDILSLVPLMNSNSEFPDGWLIIDDWSYWKIYGTLGKQSNGMINPSNLASIFSNKDITVTVINKDGKIVMCKVEGDNPFSRTIIYQNGIYFKVSNGGTQFYFNRSVK